MNRKITITSVVALAALTMTACSTTQTNADNRYEARGIVDAKQIDYDCETNAAGLDIDPVAYSKGRGGGSSSRGGSSGGGSKPKGSTSKGNAPRENSKPNPSKKPKKTPGKSPERPGHHTPQQCRTEYELFIRSNGDLFEQDVTQEHYERCDAREKFPECIK